jgi:hypothetical protein
MKHRSSSMSLEDEKPRELSMTPSFKIEPILPIAHAPATISRALGPTTEKTPKLIDMGDQ